MPPLLENGHVSASPASVKKDITKAEPAKVDNCSISEISSVSSLDLEESPESAAPRRVSLEDRDANSQSTSNSHVANPEDEVQYWNKKVMSRYVNFGPKHPRTAEALMNLGAAQLSCQHHVAAGKTYLSALKIFQFLYGDFHLSVARALDKVGLVASITHKNLDLAHTALSDALRIRCELLGPDHIDSIDTLNNVAGVKLNLRQFDLAVRDYRAVFEYRIGIFGSCHASVGITAYKLACILEDQFDRDAEARAYFLVAEEIYRSLRLTQSPYYVDIRQRLEALSGPQEI